MSKPFRDDRYDLILVSWDLLETYKLPENIDDFQAQCLMACKQLRDLYPLVTKLLSLTNLPDFHKTLFSWSVFIAEYFYTPAGCWLVSRAAEEALEYINRYLLHNTDIKSALLIDLFANTTIGKDYTYLEHTDEAIILQLEHIYNTIHISKLEYAIAIDNYSEKLEQHYRAIINKQRNNIHTIFAPKWSELINILKKLGL